MKFMLSTASVVILGVFRRKELYPKGKDVTTLTIFQSLRNLFISRKYEVKCSWCGHVGKMNKIPKNPGDILFMFCRNCKKEGAITYNSPGVMI